VQAISATRGSGAALEPGVTHRAGFFGAVTGVDVICRLRAEKAFKRLAVLTREATAVPRESGVPDRPVTST
jgi:hypothetical protein